MTDSKELVKKLREGIALAQSRTHETNEHLASEVHELCGLEEIECPVLHDLEVIESGLTELKFLEEESASEEKKA